MRPTSSLVLLIVLFAANACASLCSVDDAGRVQCDVAAPSQPEAPSSASGVAASFRAPPPAPAPAPPPAKAAEKVDSFPRLFNSCRCKHGHLLYYPTDFIISASLATYGEWTEGEVYLYRDILKAGDTVLDVGAHVGTMTLPLARIVGPSGRVLAFEPQRLVFRLLEANVALNSLVNVETYNALLGDEQVAEVAVPEIDPTARGNMGAFSQPQFQQTRDGEPLLDSDGQQLSMLGVNYVPQMTIDTLRVDRVDFIKLDVEMMEEAVLAGAAQVLDRDAPIIYMEHHPMRTEHNHLQPLLFRKYRFFFHSAPYFNPDNFAGKQENIFNVHGRSHNLLCVPPSRLAAVEHVIRGLQELNIVNMDE